MSGLAVQHQALLNRQMRFTVLALIEIFSLATGVISGIVAALYGYGYWALVISSVATSLGYFLLTWMFCRWRPGFPSRGAGVRSMLSFGVHITAFDIVNYFARNLDNVLLGRFWGSNILGLYSRAYNIMMMPISQVRGPLNAVAISALSHIQNDADRFKRYYIKLITFLALITMPLMTYLYVEADEVIFLLLGSQWAGAIEIFRILCLNAFVQPTMGTTGLVLVSLGQTRRYLTIGIVNSIFIVLSFLCGLPWGGVGVAVAYTVATYLTLLPTLWYSYRQSPISIQDFFSVILRPVVASIIMGFVIYGMRLYMTSMPDIVSIGCSFIIGFLTYLMVLILIPGGVPILKEIISYKSFLYGKTV
jgi:PST family polysaccharide transporter